MKVANLPNDQACIGWTPDERKETAYIGSVGSGPLLPYIKDSKLLHSQN